MYSQFGGKVVKRKLSKKNLLEDDQNLLKKL